MCKSAVSILQEVGMKLGTLPVYTEIASGTGTQQNKFSTKVTWKNYNVQGTANNKKEAKQNAAKKMLLLLLASKELSEAMLSLSGTPEICVMLLNELNSLSVSYDLSSSSEELNISSDTSITSLNSLPISNSDIKEEFVNYVGLLNEHCQANNFPAPLYQNITTAGSSHLPGFTIGCTAVSIYKEGTASTKKAAKHKAAKKVLEDLKNSTDKMNTLDVQFMEFSIDAFKYDKFKENEILTTYGQLQQKPILINRNVTVDNYVEILTNLCHSIPMLNQNSLKNVYNMHVFENSNTLKAIIYDAFKTTVEEISFASTDRNSIVGFKLNTYPVILQFGIGITKEEARKNALDKLLKFIFLFLK